MARQVVLWIQNALYKELLFQADKYYPDETGGILMGYWNEAQTEIVLKHIIGPGPKAIHELHRFEPDTEYHIGEIARIYEESAQLFSYLGDWHTHPDATAMLSRLDKRTLCKIATHPPSRTPEPIMLIIGGDHESPQLKIHILMWRKFIGLSFPGYHECVLRLYDES
ncbi:MAG: Mov34/MPN/PAD-1 family protein [Gammaproteobacteria bacterium]